MCSAFILRRTEEVPGGHRLYIKKKKTRMRTYNRPRLNSKSYNNKHIGVGTLI